AWTDRDHENQFCSSQRYIDRSFQPLGNTAPTYGQDPYRVPNLPGNAGTRFRFDTPPIPGIGTASGGLPAAEVYRPCPATGAGQSRVGFAGHSQGGAVILGFQGDARVSAMVDYDGGTTAAASNTFQPIMYQGEDGVAFTFSPPTASNAGGAANTTPQAASGFGDLRSRNVDTMGLSFRAWTHTDYNGNG